MSARQQVTPSTQDYDYLSEEFDPRKSTISQLCSILSKHQVELPLSKQRKEVYVDLFMREIHLKRKEIRVEMKSVKPSSQGIEMIDYEQVNISTTIKHTDKKENDIANDMENDIKNDVKPIKVSSKIPVIKDITKNIKNMANTIETPGRKDTAKVTARDYDDEKVMINDHSKMKPSLMTAIKPVQPVKRKSLDSEKILQIRGEMLLSDDDDDDVDVLPEKRLKVTDIPLVSEQNADINHIPWTPRLAWKLNKPPTPMQIKIKSTTSKQELMTSYKNGDGLQIEAPKQKRFNIQPQLPGVRQNLPHFSPQKVTEHLKPVKELIAKFDDGVPVIPGVAFQSSNHNEHDSDSTLSAPEEYEDSFLIEKDESFELCEKNTAAINESSFDSLKNDMNFEKTEAETLSTQERSFFSTLVWLFKSFFTFSVFLVFAIVATWTVNKIATSSSSFDKIASKIQADLIFAYRNPEAAFDFVYLWALKNYKAIGNWNYISEISMKTVEYLSQKANSFSKFNVTDYVVKSINYVKSVYAFSHPVLLTQMHLQDFQELVLEYTLPWTEKITNSLTQYSLIAKYEISKIIILAQNNQLINASLVTAEQIFAVIGDMYNDFARFLVSQVKRTASKENWDFIAEMLKEYQLPFGLDGQSFIALLFGSGLTFGAIGAFLLLI